MTNTNTLYSFLMIAMIFMVQINQSQAQVLEEGFETWPPVGWTMDTVNGNGAWGQDNGANNGPGSAYEGDQAAIFRSYDFIPGVTGSMTTPAFDISTSTDPIVHLFWWNDDAPLEPCLLIINTSTDGTSFIAIDTIIATGSGPEWIEYNHLLNNNVTHIKLTAISDYGLKNTFVDAFSIEEAPNCLPPTNLVVDELTSTTALINWTIGNNETAWNVEYGLIGFAQGSGTSAPTTNHPFLIEGLDAHTDYDVYVQADCDGDSSPWTGPITFTTSCLPVIDFPYSEGFEEGDFACFSVVQNNVDQTWYWSNEVSFITPPAGDGFARIAYSVDEQDEWLISPVMDLTAIDAYLLSFYWAMSYTYSVSPSDNYDLILKATTDGNIWTDLWDESMVGEFENWTYYQQSIDLTEYQGTSTFQFAFVYQGADGAAAYIDEVMLDITTSVSGNKIDLGSRVYPNPAQDFIRIESKEEIQKICIYNIAGQMIGELNSVHSNSLKVSTSDYNDGHYYMTIQTENNIESKAFHIIH